MSDKEFAQSLKIGDTFLIHTNTTTVQHYENIAGKKVSIRKEWNPEYSSIIGATICETGEEIHAGIFILKDHATHLGFANEAAAEPVPEPEKSEVKIEEAPEQEERSHDTVSLARSLLCEAVRHGGVLAITDDTVRACVHAADQFAKQIQENA